MKPYTFVFINGEGETQTETIWADDHSEAYDELCDIFDVCEVIDE